MGIGGDPLCEMGCKICVGSLAAHRRNKLARFTKNGLHFAWTIGEERRGRHSDETKVMESATSQGGRGCQTVQRNRPVVCRRKVRQWCGFEHGKNASKARTMGKDGLLSVCTSPSFSPDLLPHCCTGSMGKKLPTINDGLWVLLARPRCEILDDDLHVMIVPLDCKREAAVNLRIVRHFRAPQCTACQHGFLLLIEAYGAEFLPVANELVFHDDLVDC